MILFKRKKRQFASVEITPLIDILFLLLIFFIISSTFLRPAIKLKLPILASGVQEKQNRAVITIDSRKKMFVNQKLITLAQLTEELEMLRPLKDITFRADSQITYDLIVKVMEKLKSVGIKNISLEYEAKNELSN